MTGTKRTAWIGLLALAVAGCAEVKNPPSLTAPRLVEQAKETVERIRSSRDFQPYRRQLDEARGVLVMPSVIKAGFLGAGEFGSGVLLVRGRDGSWSYPAFYTLGSASFGLQIGIQDVEMMMVLRNDKAVTAVINHQGKLGADLGLTLGTLGAGVEAATTTNLGADILVFSNAVLGAFGGISLEGAVLARRKDFNEAYYGPGATPQAIVLDRSLANPQADPLLASLASGR